VVSRVRKSFSPSAVFEFVEDVVPVVDEALFEFAAAVEPGVVVAAVDCVERSMALGKAVASVMKFS
jgi:hypothetical protein